MSRIRWNTTRALEHRGHIERVHAIAVTNNFFKDLGVIPLLGRVIGHGDSHVAVLSYAYWSRSLGRDPAILGQAVNIEGHAFTVIGITPQAFTGTMVDTSPDLWIPFADQLEFSHRPNPNLDNYAIEIIARLRPGITAAQAQRETAALWERYLREAGFNNPRYHGLKRGSLEVRSIAHGVSPIRDQSRTRYCFCWPEPV